MAATSSGGISIFMTRSQFYDTQQNVHGIVTYFIVDPQNLTGHGLAPATYRGEPRKQKKCAKRSNAGTELPTEQRKEKGLTSVPFAERPCPLPPLLKPLIPLQLRREQQRY